MVVPRRPVDGLTDVRRVAGHLVRWIAIGGAVGVLAGLSSALFLEALDRATEARLDHPWLIWLLPVAGLAVGLVYQAIGGTAARGNDLVLDEIHEPRAGVPARMAPLVLGGTIVTHVVGGSAGREGTAIQMSAGLSAGAARLAHLGPTDRRLVLIAAIAGGFGAVFGVPFAGCVFALEVQSVGRIRHDALVGALTASIVGDRVVRALDVEHTPVPVVPEPDLTVALLAKVVAAGIVFGLAAVAFVALTHAIRRVVDRRVRWAPARPVLGGVAVLGLTGLAGTRDYLGLSIPLITQALAGGVGLAVLAFAWKLVFTAVTIGTGFKGGEVTPLFVIGATLGATLADGLDAPVPLFAAIGFVAVFAGATNTPLACAVMGVELFGTGVVVPVAVACVVAYVCSPHHGIYAGQRVDTPKAPGRPDSG